MGGAATLTRRQGSAAAPAQLEPATVAQLLDAYRQQNLGTLLGVLTRRPGEFARQLGRLSRLFPQHVAAIAEAFASVGRTLPLDELVRLHNRYSNATRGVGRSSASTIRGYSTSSRLRRSAVRGPGTCSWPSNSAWPAVCVA